MTDHIDNRPEFDAQTAAAVAVRDWIDNTTPTDPTQIRPALLGCTPAMVAQIACNAYRDHLAEHGNTFTFDELRITLVTFAKWLLAGGRYEGREVELVDRFIDAQADDDESDSDVAPEAAR